MTRTRDMGTKGKLVREGLVLKGALHLLLIGIDRYMHWNPLRSAVRDAGAVREALKKRYGLLDGNIRALFDSEATAENIDRAFRAYAGAGGGALDEDDSLLIYYAGHGNLDEITGTGAWVPVDARKDTAAAWIDNSRIKAYLKAITARHVLLVSDSCFAGDFFRDAGGVTEQEITDAYVAGAYAKSSRQALTSGGLEVVADDGFRGHSVFAHFLLKELNESPSPWLVPSDLHARIRGGVAQNASQTPMLGYLAGAGGEEGGEFVLFRRDFDSMLEERQKALEELRAKETVSREQREKERKEQEERQEQLDALDAEIRALEENLESSGGEGGTLDELLSLIEEKERKAKELEALRQRQEEEERARQGEIERLKREAKQKRRDDFEADWEKYQKITASPLASDGIKDKAWRALVKKWEIGNADARTDIKPEWNGDVLKLPIPDPPPAPPVPPAPFPPAPLRPVSGPKPSSGVGVAGWLIVILAVMLVGSLYYYTYYTQVTVPAREQAAREQVALSSASAYNNRGFAWRGKGEYDKAIADYTEAIKLDPGYALAYGNRGFAWNEKGEYDKAIVDYTEAIKLDPGYAAAYNNRGFAWGKKGEYDKAIADYTEAIKLDPGFTAAYTNRGMAHEEIGNIEAARTDYKRALSLPANYSNGKWAHDTARSRLERL